MLTRPTPIPPFTLAGDALTSALKASVLLGALKAAKPILDDLEPGETQAPDPELARVRRIVAEAISIGEQP
jgi:hypothetical protein